MTLISEPTDACVVFVTCGSQEEALGISETLVQERLAACVNIIGSGQAMQSIYLWEGKLQKETEILLVIKTKKAHLPELEQRIRELHSYTVPEFIALSIMSGSQAYLSWLGECVEKAL